MSGSSRGASLRRQRIRLAVTVAAGAIAVVVVGVLAGPIGEGGPSAAVGVDGSSWLGTDPIGPVITEVVSSNASTLADQDGDQPDWIELHNPTHEPIDLEGYHLSDDEDDPARWTFPAVVLEPDSHLVVFASGKDRRDASGELHTDFRLAQGDEPVLLVEPDGGTVADRIEAVDIPRNASFGRPPAQLARTCYFAFPSPGSPNTDECFDDTDLGAPTLSQATGFYDEPFDLEITAPNPDATIYYTLDGSYPDPDTNPDNTLVYDGPLRIVDRSPEPNTISMIPTTVPEHREFVAPDHEIPKGTAIRGRTRHSATSVATYFVGDVPSHGDLAVVALTIDPDYLFDHDIGIHVGGRKYEEWAASDAYDPDARWLDVEANYLWRGREWERPARDELRNAVSLEFCQTRRSCDYQQQVGVRTHGGASRTFPNKSLRLYARADYAAETFDYDFWGDGTTEHSRLILRNSGNDWNILRFADAFLQSLMTDFVSETQAARPTVVYVNGEYWGIHNIRERQDEHFLRALYGLDPDDIEMLDNSTHPTNERRRADPPEGDFYRASPSSPDLYEAWMGFVVVAADAEAGSDSFLDLIEESIDVDSFNDFIIGHVFTAVIDWGQNNSRWWRTAGESVDSHSPKADGRWRFMIADLDSWGQEGGELDSFSGRLAPGQAVTDHDGLATLFNSMMENETLRSRFIGRFTDNLNTSFNPTRTVPELRRWEDAYAADIPTHGERWSTRSLESWQNRVDRLATFLETRPDIQREHLRERFDLGEDRSVQVEFEPTDAIIQLNSFDLGNWVEDADSAVRPAVWEGIYFDGQTLTLAAIPIGGSGFSHWLINDETRLDDPDIDVTVSGDLHVRLVMEPTG